MPCISTKRSCRRKNTSSGEVKKTIVYQVEHTGTNTAKQRTLAERSIESQSTIEEQQRKQGKRTMQENKRTTIGRRGGFYARNTRSSSSRSTGVSTNYTTGTQRSTRAHASSSNKKSWVSRKQVKETFYRE
jgi:hypothetical protein